MSSETGRWSSSFGRLKQALSYWHWMQAWRAFFEGEDTMDLARYWWLEPRWDASWLNWTLGRESQPRKVNRLRNRERAFRHAL